MARFERAQAQRVPKARESSYIQVNETYFYFSARVP